MAWRVYPTVITLVLNSSRGLAKIDTELKKDNSGINTVDTTSRTALHYCILQEEGAVKSGGFDNETIIDGNNCGDCRAARDMAAITWLQLNNPSIEELDTWPRRLAIAFLLCSNGANVNVKDKGGWSILRACVQRGDLLFAQILIHFGADTSCSNLSEIAYSRGNLLCAVYLDKHSLSLRAQCRGTLRLNGYEDKVISKLFLPSPIKMFLNYNVLFPGYVNKLIPIRTISDTAIINGNASYDDVMTFIQTNTTQDFYSRVQVDRNATTVKQDLIMLMHKMYNEDCFNELVYEEPPLREPRYSMEQIPEDRMRTLGLHRENTAKKKENKKGLISHYYK